MDMKKFYLLMIILIGLSFSVSYSQAEDKKAAPLKTYTVGTPDEMPKCDLDQLQKNVVYPEKARKMGVEGKVVVRALIGDNGKVIKANIVSTDSKLLNNAAKVAVKKTEFVPAKKGGKNIKAWVTIPIVFKLN